MKLIQSSDLHLSATNDTDYCFSVLGEIVEKAKQSEADGILFCGDIFDTFADLEKLRSIFITALKLFPGFVYFLPGNHESLRRKVKDKGFEMFDWGNQIKFLDAEPFQLHKIDDEVELLALAHRESYGNLLGILPPQKNAKIRIGLAHATVSGMSFTGLNEEEEGGGIIDAAQLLALNCDYVAVGHIHSARSQRFGSCEVAYAGSSRVWRKGEIGKRGGYLLEILDGKVNKTVITWEKAGIYEEVPVSLGLDGYPEKTFEEYFNKFTGYDWVRIKWSGIIETMSGLTAFKQRLLDELKPKVRILEFDPDESEIRVVASLSENTYMQKFLDVMETKKDKMETDLWKRAKKLGLELLFEGKK